MSPLTVLGPKETWGDKGREGIPKNEKLGIGLLWMFPYEKNKAEQADYVFLQ